jgi:hypothetical protein
LHTFVPSGGIKPMAFGSLFDAISAHPGAVNPSLTNEVSNNPNRFHP